MYDSKNLDRLLKLCRQHQVLTIADEVMTGFGRTQALFACDHLNEKPDIICLSKGITGGFLPLGATGCKKFIYEAFLSTDKSKAFLHGHSYTANPLACVSALASLDLLQDSLCTTQRSKITHAHARFCKKWRGHPKLKRCESLGTILVLEYHHAHDSYFSPLGDTLYAYFIKKHLILRPLGNALYVLPPYCITEEELTYIYQAIEQTIEGSL